jgi:hypothetical protein
MVGDNGVRQLQFAMPSDSPAFVGTQRREMTKADTAK